LHRRRIIREEQRGDALRIDQAYKSVKVGVRVGCRLFFGRARRGQDDRIDLSAACMVDGLSIVLSRGDAPPGATIDLAGFAWKRMADRADYK